MIRQLLNFGIRLRHRRQHQIRRRRQQQLHIQLTHRRLQQMIH
jgi:hypothetical protein